MNKNSVPSRGLLSVTGEEAKKLLQGQLTCDLEKITPNSSSFGAHCNPQGRVISFFKIFMHEDSYYLLMPRSLIPVAQNALKKYAVFFKVTLSDASDSTLFEIENVFDITAGIPAIYPETSEKFLPHELNLQKLHAISFDKGCYTGQEIIARMQYRGKLKNHLYLARAITATPPVRNDEIFNPSSACGNIVDFIQISYNTYEILVVAPEADVQATSLFLDAARTVKLEFLEL